MRKTAAWIILFVLIVVPFLNWQIGAVAWMCAFLVYVLQQVFSGNPFTVARKPDDVDRDDDDNEQKNSDTKK